MSSGRKKKDAIDRGTGKSRNTLDLDALIQAAVIAYGDKETVSRKIGIPVEAIEHMLLQMESQPSSSTWWRGAGWGFVRAAKMYGAPFMDWYLGHLDYTNMEIEEAIKTDMYWEIVMMSVVQGKGMANKEVCGLIESASSMSRIVERIRDRKMKEEEKVNQTNKKDDIQWVLKLSSRSEEDYCNTDPSSIEFVR